MSADRLHDIFAYGLILTGLAILIMECRRFIGRREVRTQAGIDRAFAIVAARSGQSDERIAAELGRPAHVITTWREAEGVEPGADVLDLAQEARIRQLIRKEIALMDPNTGSHPKTWREFTGRPSGVEQSPERREDQPGSGLTFSSWAARNHQPTREPHG